MLTILTANQKGGCGKTSISLTLAVALAHEGYKVANRIRPQLMDGGVPSDKLLAIFDEMGQRPLAYISEKSAYAQLADDALTIFDKTQKPYQDAKGQWQPILVLIKNKLSGNGKCSGMSTDGSWF